MFHVIMTKTGHAATAYLNKWEQMDDGIKYAFSPSQDRAVPFTGEDAVYIISVLRTMQSDTSIKYSTTAA